MKKIFSILSLLFFINTVNSQTLKKSIKKGVDDILEIVYKKSDINKNAPKVIKFIPISSVLKKWSKSNNFILKPNKYSIEIFNKSNEYLGKITTKGKHKVVTAHPLIGRKTVNPLLDANLFPNTTYKVENCIFKTDKMMRVTSAEISSIPKSVIQRNSIKGAKENSKAMAKDGIKGVDHGGHLIAHSLGGNSGSINILAQLGKLNTGKFASIEKLIRMNKSQIKKYNVTAIYKGISKRPISFIQKFEYRGNVKELIEMQKRNPNFKYLKKKDVNGNVYYKCLIFHKNM